MDALTKAVGKVVHLGEANAAKTSGQGTLPVAPTKNNSAANVTEDRNGPPDVRAAAAAIAGGMAHTRKEETGGLGQDMVGHPLQGKAGNYQYSGANLGGTVVGTAAVTITSNKDPHLTMQALTWHAAKDVRMETRPRPLVTDPKDAILRVTSTAICGSDLHIYTGAFLGLQKGDILGHEFMGIVESVGPEVKDIKVGDRVVACFDIACGCCRSCSRQAFSSCDCTNPSRDQELMYGARSGGFYGFAHLTGGFEGGQAEYVRVPFADHGLIKVPDNLSDEQVVLLSDILSTAWHSVVNAGVGPGTTVAIWGAGPGGILAAHCAMVRGAGRVALIDCVDYRLEYAKARLPGLITINFNKEKVKETIERFFPGGPDVCVELVGFHYSKTYLHAIEKKLLLETDGSDIINELIYCCRKQGTISLAGVYIGLTNHFNIGGLMEKCLTLVSGQTPVQKYWHHLLELIQQGKLHPEMVLTHTLPLEEAPRGYKIFNDKVENCVKVLLKPGMGQARAEPAGHA